MKQLYIAWKDISIILTFFSVTISVHILIRVDFTILVINTMSSSIDESDLSHIWQYASNTITELASARLFITGGTGFFGCWLLESLRYAKINLNFQTEIVVLTRNAKAFENKMPHLATMPGLQLLNGDITNFTYPKGEFTHIIHAATEASATLNQEQPLTMFNTITQGMRYILEFAAQKKAKFLFTSSGAVYGIQPPSLSHIDESYTGSPDIFEPTSAYGLGKRMAEHLGMLYAKQYHFEIKIARCFAFVGPYLPLASHFAIGNFINNVRQQKPIQILGDGSPFRSYLYAADLVIWLWTILCQGEPGKAYNVGSKEAINLATLAEKVTQIAHTNLPVLIAKQPNPNALPSRYVPQIARAENELQLKQWINLEDSIQRTLQWSLTQ